MIEILPYARRYLLAAALLLISSVSWAAVPQGMDQLSAAEWASVHAQIMAHRYHAEGDAADGYRARNDALGLDQRYFPDGRTQVKGQHLGVSLQLKAYGYGQLIQAGTPALRAETDEQGAVVHYQWDSNLREWWHNRPDTLEQWFELQQRPAGADGGPLQLQMALHVPDETPVMLDSAGQELRIGEGEGALHYAGLKVWDADGQILAARMHLNQDGDLLLSVDDAAARYPVTIDPVWSQVVYLKASNPQEYDRFGYSMALSRDTLAVGAVGAEAVYVFVRAGETQWQQVAIVKPSNPGLGDQFGRSVALSGDTLVVGAPLEASSATGVNGNPFDNSRINAGAAYVFVRTGGSVGAWSQQAYLKASNTDRFHEFGSAVAVSGDLVVVGAPRENSSATGINGDPFNNDAELSGAVYVYGRNSVGQWFFLEYVKASNTGAGDQFGHSVAIDGNTFVVGAHREDSNATGVNGNQANNSATDSGAAYVFVRPGGVLFDSIQVAYLKASNTDAGDLFGHSVAISGDTLVVGAYGESSNATGVNGNQSDNSAERSGAAYVFVRTGGLQGSWSQQAYLKASNTDAYDLFGYSVGLSGNLLVVGAPGEASNARGIDGNQANNSMPGSGAAYAFARSGTSWIPQAYIKASNTERDQEFGHSVAVISSALWGNRLVVGSPSEGSPGIGVNGIQGPPNGRFLSGAAYGFNLNPTVGGSVAGLDADRSLTLRYDNGTVFANPDDVVVDTNGEFNFGTVRFDTAYNVTVATQPAGQFCTVANGSGTVLTHITDIEVNCAANTVSNTFTIGGSLSGMFDSRIVTLENTDSGDSLTLTSNGTFSFVRRLGTGNTYNIVVTGQPNGQICTVANGVGTVTGTVSNIQVSCTGSTYTISGTVSGLDPGLSVSLQNGGDNLTLTTNGSFVFPTPITHGASYAVTVTSQPVGKECVVSANGTGNAFENIDIQVNCFIVLYTIGGTVSGLAPGRSVTLRQSVQNLVVNANGSFAFEFGQTLNTPYTVIVFSQPVGQTCAVSNGSGVVTGDVSDVEVNCVTNSHSIGGTLFGLAADGSVTLQNNGGDDLTLDADGAFVFPTQVLHGEPYAVTVSSAPAGQSCFVNNGSGTVSGTVSNVAINCVTGVPATVGGTVSGLGSGRVLTLQNNGGDDLTLSANGAFVFPAPISEGATYLVTVRTQPTHQTCTVSNGEGAATGNVSDVAITCTDSSYSVGGTLGGLAPNRSITLQNNGGDDLVLSEFGFFIFPTLVPQGAPFNITVSSQPLGQVCTVDNGMGLVNFGSFFTEVFCVTNRWIIGGTVSGLDEGASITLQNNGGDDLTLTADGSFVFLVPVTTSTPYSVSVSVQPVGQTCTVSNGAGNASSDVNNVAVNCISNSYSIGGTLSGLGADGSIRLQNNGSDDLVLGADGSFSFNTLTPHGVSYSVTVLIPPVGQTCAVSNGSGTATGNVSNVLVSCMSTVYTVGGSLTGLAGGTSVVLQNNDGDDLTLSTDGPFAFATALTDLSAYAVTVLTQPSNPNQTCIVANGSGSLAGANVSGVEVTCATDTYTVGGSLTGLAGGTSVVLQNNDGDDLTLSTDGPFAFATALTDLSAFAVTVLTQPSNPNQTCIVANGSGSLAGANVSSVEVTCATDTYTVGGSLTGLAGGASVVLQNNDGDDLTLSTDGPFTFATTLSDLSAYAVTVLTQPSNPTQTCIVANGSGSLAGANVTEVSVTCTTNTYTVTPNAGANGSISPSTPQLVNHGETISFQVTPDSNFLIDDVSGCDGSLLGDIYTTGPITADCSVQASFDVRILLQVLAGSGQVASLGSAFGQSLVVRVIDVDGTPMAGIEVAFTAPTTGASAVLGASSALSNAQGVALVQASANLVAGGYDVEASIPALSMVAPISFVLENVEGDVLLTPSIGAGREYARYGQTINYLVRVRNDGDNAIYDMDLQVTLSEALDEDAATWLCLNPLSGCVEQGSGALNQSGLLLAVGDTVSFLYSVPVRLLPDEHQAEASLQVEAGSQVTSASTLITLVMFRNDFDSLYTSAEHTPPAAPAGIQSGALAEGALLELAVPASNPSGHVTLWQTQGAAELPMRVEQMCAEGHCWLRIVAAEFGVERISAWTPWQDDAVPLLSRSRLGAHDVLWLDAGGGMVELRIRRDLD